MQKELEIQLDDRTVTVKRLNLKQVGEAFRKMQKLTSVVSGFEGKSNEEIFSSLPQLLGENWDELGGVFSIATNFSEEELMECGILDSSKIIFAFLELNNFEEIKHFLSLIRGRKELSPKERQKALKAITVTTSKKSQIDSPTEPSTSLPASTDGAETTSSASQS